MTDRQQIQEWLDRFMAGTATEQEEQQLADYFCSAVDVPEEWMSYAVLFRGFRRDHGDRSLDSNQDQGPVPMIQRHWMAAAAAVILLIVGGAWVWQRQLSQSEDECVAYIYGERTTDREVVLCEMQKTMAVVTYDGGDVVEEQLKGIFGIE
jgi:ferric-dicitrate binding protein FerR (iron transport regulator)